MILSTIFTLVIVEASFFVARALENHGEFGAIAGRVKKFVPICFAALAASIWLFNSFTVVKAGNVGVVVRPAER